MDDNLFELPNPFSQQEPEGCPCPVCTGKSSVAEYKADITNQVKSKGWFGMYVLPDDGEEWRQGPPYFYTTGFYHTLQQPELLIVGLRPETCQALCQAIFDVAKDKPGLLSTGRMNGFSNVETDEEYDFWLLDLPEHLVDEMMVITRWFYDGEDFEARQLVYPDEDGFLPWVAGSQAKEHQMIYGLNPPGKVSD